MTCRTPKPFYPFFFDLAGVQSLGLVPCLEVENGGLTFQAFPSGRRICSLSPDATALIPRLEAV